MSTPLFTTFLAEVENLAGEYEFEIVNFTFSNGKAVEGEPKPPLLTIKFKPLEKGTK